MKFLTWNASMRFRDKIEKVFPFDANILVIPECEAPEKWRNSKHLHAVNQFLWYGDNQNKGIGIMTLNGLYKIKLHPAYNKNFRYIIPIIVTGPQSFILFAVWSQQAKKQAESYIGQIHLALQAYESLLQEQCMIAGDWNSNKIFDSPKRVGTHSQVVNFLQKKGIRSIYHDYFHEAQGCETIPTYYFRKEKNRPFHLDYVFASEMFLKHLGSVEVGSYENWIKFSDHVPIYLELEKK